MKTLPKKHYRLTETGGNLCGSKGDRFVVNNILLVTCERCRTTYELATIPIAKYNAESETACHSGLD